MKACPVTAGQEVLWAQRAAFPSEEHRRSRHRPCTFPLGPGQRSRRHATSLGKRGDVPVETDLVQCVSVGRAQHPKTGNRDLARRFQPCRASCPSFALPGGGFCSRGVSKRVKGEWMECGQSRDRVRSPKTPLGAGGDPRRPARTALCGAGASGWGGKGPAAVLQDCAPAGVGSCPGHLVS